MRLLLVFVFSAIFSWVAYGRQDVVLISQLQKRLPQQQELNRIATLNKLGWEYRLSEPDSTLYYCRQAIELAQRLQTSRGIAESLNYMGLASSYKGDYPTAFDYHQKALNIATATADSSQIAHSLNSIGRIFYVQGNPVRSYDYYLKALDLFTQLGDSSGMGYTYNSLSQLYELQEELGKALEVAKKALAIRQQQQNRRGQVSSYQTIARLYTKLGTTEQATVCLQKARDISRELGEISLAEIELGLAELYLNAQRYEEALQNGQEAFQVIDRSHNRKLMAQASLMMGCIHLKMGHFSQAHTFLDQVIKYAQESGNLEEQQRAFLHLSELAERENNYRQAYQHYRQHEALQDSLYSTEKARLMEQMDAQLKIDRIEQEYKLLKATEEKNQLIIEHERLKDIAQYLILALAVALATVLVVAYVKRRKQNEELVVKNNRIEEQNREIIKRNLFIEEQNLILQRQNQDLRSMDEEKDQFMRIVAHDLKSPFNSIKGLTDLLPLDGNLTEEQQQFVTLIRQLSNDSLQLITKMLDIHALEHSSQVNTQEVMIEPWLENALRPHRAKALQKGITLRCESEEGLLLETDELYLTRILDNLVSNAVKYSSSGKLVEVNVYRQQHHVCLSVRDQGPGFTEQDKEQLYRKFRRLSAKPTQGEESHGLGLSIVKTLVEKLDASIVLHSHPDQGSEFVVTFPLTAKQLVP
ncbi:Signal transduction histidine kinase [Catalinimonas alkaloidigena]|uniref:histidine kinase n=1 Tax=Catalinimonas alkaloidigena TaxID=1075417 RepID=A0A1G9F2F3_9BACT|nr:tetratricopeptide repeat protein [Catalinimonas alkaloidigena]SDK82639.1 Signal transduction histidine kinase [Catalinimonas alkaloidigena]